MSSTKRKEYHSKDPPHPSPAPNPERAIYGFALFLSSVGAGVVYLVWALVPPKYLIGIGIDFLPSRYWAIVVPLCICALILLIPVFYGIICLRCMPQGGLEHLDVDVFSRTSEYHRILNTAVGGIPPLCDMPLELLKEDFNQFNVLINGKVKNE
jgi:hypothetical protein